MHSQCVKELLEYIEDGTRGEMSSSVRTLNAVSCYPLAYRTFGGQKRGNSILLLDDKKLETVFGSHYLLTMLASGAIIRKMLYRESNSCHSLYCDGVTYSFLDHHGLIEHGVWDMVDHSVLDENITLENVDHRIYYSAPKPFAMLNEAVAAKRTLTPVMFVDADLILKKPHYAILKHPKTIRAAYGHLESIGTQCYPDFRSLHLPDKYELFPDCRMDLPAVNTCLMYFNDLGLMTEWSVFFKDLFMNNWLTEELNQVAISRQLLGIDQRTFPMIAAKHGYWGGKEIEGFLDIIWNPPYFYYNQDGKKAEWHYYTLEHHPEKTNWLQNIMHTWISKHDIERDTLYRNYQGCMMLEIILELEPGIEPFLHSFSSLQSYFSLMEEYGSIEKMLAYGAVSNKLNKS